MTAHTPDSAGLEDVGGQSPDPKVRALQAPGLEEAGGNVLSGPAATETETKPGLDKVSSHYGQPHQHQAEARATGGSWKHRFRGGAVGFIGFLLSPLSWWNDLFVNIPLALGFAWLVALVRPAAFEAAFIAGYWLTNVLGLVLLTRGAKELLAGKSSLYSRGELLKDLAIALVYTGLMVALLKLGWLKPVQDYFPTGAAG